MPYVICEPCVGTKDQACVEVCPVVNCIIEDSEMCFINPSACIDCGQCEPECPVDAIYAEDEVPAQWENYVKMNREFFA